jgi:hypothetical protein
VKLYDRPVGKPSALLLNDQYIVLIFPQEIVAWNRDMPGSIPRAVLSNKKSIYNIVQKFCVLKEDIVLLGSRTEFQLWNLRTQKLIYPSYNILIVLETSIVTL